MDGNIPVLLAEGRTLPEVWEKSVIEVWEKGIEIKTEYDKPGDPPSKDCTMVMVIHEPMGEPRIHRAFPGGLENLEIYKEEVLDGIHDHWINPQEGKWTYTYHKRLFEYEMDGKAIDQINYIITKLSSVVHSRRAQAITWNVSEDPPTDDPPCLQRIWCRIFRDEKGRAVLNMNSHWRSRDSFKASFMNIFALTELQSLIARKISEKRGEEVLVGRYVDIADSYHIYGAYYKDFKMFLDTVRNRSFEERTWTTEFAMPVFEETRKNLEKESRESKESRV